MDNLSKKRSPDDIAQCKHHTVLNFLPILRIEHGSAILTSIVSCSIKESIFKDILIISIASLERYIQDHK